MLTVFTSTYNRAYKLGKLYESLRLQTSKDFEWIVIDDGSEDDTKEYFDKWIYEDNSFPIVYERIPNGGKHRAINKGVKMASAEGFFIVDSDDYLLPEAIEKADAWFNQIADCREYAGVSGLKGENENTPIGGYGTFDGEYVDCTNLERHLYNLLDDKAEIYKTDILREYSFPEYEGEKFVPESLAWESIARDGYKIRWFNEIIYICEYLQDGLTASANRKFIDSPRGFLAYLEVLESVHDPREVDVFRLQFYNDLIKEKGMDYAVKIINMANQMKKT